MRFSVSLDPGPRWPARRCHAHNAGSRHLAEVLQHQFPLVDAGVVPRQGHNSSLGISVTQLVDVDTAHERNLPDGSAVVGGPAQRHHRGGEYC